MAHDTTPHETVSCSIRLLGALDATALAEAVRGLGALRPVDVVRVNENEHVMLFSAHRNEVDERSLYIVPETLSVPIPCDRATLHDADALLDGRDGDLDPVVGSFATVTTLRSTVDDACPLADFLSQWAVWRTKRA